MSLKDRLKADLLQARKDKNEAARNVLAVVLGDVQTEESTRAALSDAQIEAKLRKLAENNQQVIDANPTAAKVELLRGRDRRARPVPAQVPGGRRHPRLHRRPARARSGCPRRQ